MKKSYLIAPIALGASLAVVIPTHAQLIASEGFNYTPGTSMASVGTAGNGWANVWADKGNLDVLQSGSLAYTDGSGNTLATSGNNLQSNGSSTGSSSSEPQRTITGTFGTLALANPAAPDTLWMSYLWQGGNTTTASGTLFRQATLMFLKGASTTSTSPGGTEYMDIGMPNISSANVGTVSPNISLWASSGNAGQTANGAPISSLNPVQSTVPANDGNTDFILIELTGSATAWSAAGNSETMNVWINPSLTQSTPVGAPNISYAQQDLSTINAIRAQGGGLNTTYGPLPGEESVDEINIGDTAADVEPLVSPVPEPTSIALAAIGGLSLLALKRKRS